ncbi:MAG: hypothetical protein K6G34_12170 [Lachnospiraceae bacterium]|nr:hypothetical protein [Lachnospiraceae bacterium]
MRYRRILLMITILLASMAGLTACGGDEYESDEFEGGNYGDEEESAASPNSAGLSADSQSSAKEAEEDSKGLFMQVDKATGKMLIRRPGQDTSAST